MSVQPEVGQLGFLHHHEDVQPFGREVLPLVRKMEAAELAGSAR
jgi:hypothetical protein